MHGTYTIKTQRQCDTDMASFVVFTAVRTWQVPNDDEHTRHAVIKPKIEGVGQLHAQQAVSVDHWQRQSYHGHFRGNAQWIEHVKRGVPKPREKGGDGIKLLL